MAQREQRALQTDSSSGRAMAAASRTLRSGLKAMTAVLTPQRRQAATEQQGTDGPERQTEMSTPARDLFKTDTPEKPRRPVPARSSDVVAMCASEAAVAQGQRDFTAAAPEEYARALGVSVQVQSSQDGAVVQGDRLAQMLQMLQRMQESQAQMLQMHADVRAEMQELRAEVRAEVQLVKKEVQQVRTEVRTEVEQRVCAIEAKQAQLQAQVMGVSASFAESASTGEQQRTIEQTGRVNALEQQLQQIQHEQGKLKGNEERVLTIEQRLIELEVHPAKLERQQRLEDHQDIVEQQWQNRHARELEEQARLLQVLRDEQERLREEQEKMKGNEKRICAKIEQYMLASAQLVKEEAIDPLLAKYEQLEMASPSTETSLVQKGAEATSSVAALQSPAVESKTSKPLVFGFSAGPFPPRAKVYPRFSFYHGLVMSAEEEMRLERMRLEREKAAKGNTRSRDASKISNDDDSDDDDQQRAPELDRNMECCRVEISEPESLQFRDAFEEGRAQAHADIAFQEGYQHGEKEAAANWEIEREMAESYSSACVTDSMLDEREAVWSAEEETRSSGGNEREAEWRTEEETRSGGSNERGAENGEEEDWRTAQWEPLDFVW